jgi:pimeloyl-ACP methyl ester carboxylesterase
MSEPLVLLPGMMCDARAFLSQVVDLSLERPVTVAPVTKGERIEEIASCILSGLPGKFALAGHDMGGGVAMEIARRAPERVTRLALMSTSPMPDAPQFSAAREDSVIAAKTGRLQDALQGEIDLMGFAPGPARVPVQQGLMEMGMELGADVYVRQVRALQRRRDQQATLRQIRQPCLILCGAHDRITPIKRHEFMAELVPYARLHVIENAGHLPQLEAPSETSQALATWMRQPLVLR